MTLQKALKDWRRRRGMSQEQLGFEANVSARHIAFIETGRARPSRRMVVRLSEALDVPRIDRNTLLEAAGFAPLYKARDMDDADTQLITEGLHWMLARVEPYPAFVIDRHWHLLKLNQVAEVLFAKVGVSQGDSLLEALLAPKGLRQAIVNWSEVAHYFAQRLRTESRHLGGDEILLDAANALFDEAGQQTEKGFPAVVHTRYRNGDQELSFYSTIAQLGSAEDIALADLRIELLFPSDETTRQVLVGMFSTST